MRVPVFTNGLGRGTLPADHELAFLRTRGLLRQEADLVVVVGTPLDFRLGFGRFGTAQVAHVVDAESQRSAHVDAVTVAGDLDAVLRALAEQGPSGAGHDPWIEELRAAEDAAREAEIPLLAADADPIKPTRVYGELRRRLARDAVVICDGGDFASYAGKYVEVLRARVLARHRAVRMSRERDGVRPRRPGRSAGRAGRGPARRRGGRVQPDGCRLVGAPRTPGRDGGREQRDVGAGEAPDAGDLRVGYGVRPPAGVSLRRGGAGARRGGRDGHRSRRGRTGARPGLRIRRAVPGQRA